MLNKKNVIFVSIGVILAAVLVLVLSFAVLKGRQKLTVKEPVYIVINGEKSPFKSGVKLENKDGSTILRDGKNAYAVDEFPILYENRDAVLFQTNGSWNRVDTDEIFRFDCFTEVEKKEDGLYIQKGNKKAIADSGFLYDNRDTYLLLEPATLSLNGEEIELQEMTVIHCKYLEYISIYGPDMKPTFEELTKDQVLLTFSNGKSVNVSSDRYYQANGTWRLLFLPLDVLNGWK